MRDTDKETALTKVKKRSSWLASQENSEGNETVNRYTMLAIGAAIFLAGFWALTCLVNAFFQTGPLSLLGQLATAITGR